VTHPYAALTPEVVLDACEAAGLRPDGRLLPLNSYENRVYQVWLEEGSARVLKFYRPERWSAGQIEEEHAFARELAEREIPVVAPVHTGEHAGFLFAVYPRRGGRTPNLDDPRTLEWIGRFIGRIHAVGAARPFQLRPSLNVETFGDEPRSFLLERNFLQHRPVLLRSTLDPLVLVYQQHVLHRSRPSGLNRPRIAVSAAFRRANATGFDRCCSKLRPNAAAG